MEKLYWVLAIQIGKLYSGITPPLVGIMLEKSIVFGFYEKSKSAGFNNFFSGIIGGFMSTVIVTPVDRLKINYQNQDFKLLYTIDERIELLKKYDIDYLIILEFTKEFAAQSSEEFIQNILIDKLNTKKLILGYNHRFGKNREGNINQLSKYSHVYNFDVEEIPAQDIDEVSVSSTKIRRALLSGDLQKSPLCFFLRMGD